MATSCGKPQLLPSLLRGELGRQKCGGRCTSCRAGTSKAGSLAARRGRAALPVAGEPPARAASACALSPRSGPGAPEPQQSDSNKSFSPPRRRRAGQGRQQMVGRGAAHSRAHGPAVRAEVEAQGAPKGRVDGLAGLACARHPEASTRTQSARRSERGSSPGTSLASPRPDCALWTRSGPRSTSSSRGAPSQSRTAAPSFLSAGEPGHCARAVDGGRGRAAGVPGGAAGPALGRHCAAPARAHRPAVPGPLEAAPGPLRVQGERRAALHGTHERQGGWARRPPDLFARLHAPHARRASGGPMRTPGCWRCTRSWATRGRRSAAASRGAPRSSAAGASSSCRPR